MRATGAKYFALAWEASIMAPVRRHSIRGDMPGLAKAYIPALATVGNAVAGFMAIGLAMQGEPQLAALLVLVAVLFDSLDGVLARMLRASSEFGTQLDSLADMLSFGVAPAVIVGSLLPEPIAVPAWMMLAAFPLCAAIRLARFNVGVMHSKSHGSFVGLATTGAGACAASAVLAQGVLLDRGIDLGFGFLPWMLLLVAALMVSELSYPHVKALLTRMPLSTVVGTVAVLVLIAAYWEYEFVFLALFWLYAASGPALALRERIRAFRTVHPS